MGLLSATEVSLFVKEIYAEQVIKIVDAYNNNKKLPDRAFIGINEVLKSLNAHNPVDIETVTQCTSSMIAFINVTADNINVPFLKIDTDMHDQEMQRAYQFEEERRRIPIIDPKKQVNRLAKIIDSWGLRSVAGGLFVNDNGEYANGEFQSYHHTFLGLFKTNNLSMIGSIIDGKLVVLNEFDIYGNWIGYWKQTEELDKFYHHIDIEQWSDDYIDKLKFIILFMDMNYFENNEIIKEFFHLLTENENMDAWNEVNADIVKWALSGDETKLDPSITSKALILSDYCILLLVDMIQKNGGRLITSDDYEFTMIYYNKIFTNKKIERVSNNLLDRMYDMVKIFFLVKIEEIKSDNKIDNNLLLKYCDDLIDRYNFGVEIE